MIRGLSIQWRADSAVNKYAKELRKAVFEFEESVQFVIEKLDLINEYLDDLKTAALEKEVLSEKIEKIQKVIDEFEIQSFSNL